MKRRLLVPLAGCLAVAAGSAAQPPADVNVHADRRLMVPVSFDAQQRASIQQVQLLVSQDDGQTWATADAITPDKSHFNYLAKDDGTYWLTMLIRFKDGTTDPANPTRHSADRVQKNLIDTVRPVVRLDTARRDGDEVVLDWSVDDKNPTDAGTVVSVRAAGPGPAGDWQPVPAGNISKRSARFRPTVAGPVSVQVSVQDAAGNVGVVSKDLPAGATPAATPVPVVVPAVANQPGGLMPPQLPAPVLPTPSLPAPALPTPAPPPVAAVPVTPTPVAPAPLPAATPPVPAWNPPAPVAADPGPTPIAVSGNAVPAAATAPVPDAGPVQHVRFTQFQLPYQLDAGPSGVRHLDLYVTRDDGRTWARWSQHDGKENPLRVNLQSRTGGPADGDYGFKLVSVSGANLSDDVPTPGTPPDVRVRVDTQAPVIRIFPLEADPANRGSLVLRWQLADANMTDQSTVGIDWSEHPSGPWRPVGGGESGTARIPNRGTYSWQLPASLPSHLLHFKFTATDPAGNRSEAVAPPQTVDLVRPRARIQGVVTASASVPR